jgi:hypothetical protein
MKFTSNAANAQRSLQSLVCLGELGETLRQIVHPAKAVREGLSKYFQNAERRAMKEARKKAARQKRINAITSAVTGSYLEAMFGIRPLLSDIDSAAKAAARIITYRPPTEFVHAYAEDSFIAPPSVHNPVVGNVGWKSTYDGVGKYGSKLYGAIINRSGWNGIYQELGLTPGNWLPTIWELIPYSFVADYFTNIGGILEAAALCRADFAWVNKGTLLDRSRKLVSMVPQHPADTVLTYWTVSFSPGSTYSCQRRDVSRTPYLGPFIPNLEFRIPGLGTKWINMGALITQARATSSRIGRL